MQSRATAGMTARSLSQPSKQAPRLRQRLNTHVSKTGQKLLPPPYLPCLQHSSQLPPRLDLERPCLISGKQRVLDLTDCGLPNARGTNKKKPSSGWVG